jgi:hypothetical protein
MLLWRGLFKMRRVVTNLIGKINHVEWNLYFSIMFLGLKHKKDKGYIPLIEKNYKGVISRGDLKKYLG